MHTGRVPASFNTNQFWSIVKSRLLPALIVCAPCLRQISYPSKYSWALVTYNCNSFWNALKESKKPKLFVFGDQDQFSSKSHPSPEICAH